MIDSPPSHNPIVNIPQQRSKYKSCFVQDARRFYFQILVYFLIFTDSHNEFGEDSSTVPKPFGDPIWGGGATVIPCKYPGEQDIYVCKVSKNNYDPIEGLDPEAVYTVIRSIPNYSRSFSIPIETISPVPRPYSVDYIGDQLGVSTWQGLSGSTYITHLNHTLTHINRERILMSVLGEMATIYAYQMMCMALGSISRLQTLHSLGTYHLDLRTNNLLIAKDERSPIKVNGKPLELVTHPKVSVLFPWPNFDVVISDFDRSVTDDQINRGDIHLQGVTFSKKLAGLIDFRHLTQTLRLLVNSISIFLNYVSNQGNSDRRALLVAMRKMDRRLHEYEERLAQCINDESRRIQNKERSSVCFSNKEYLNFLNNLRVEMTLLYRGYSIAC